MDTQDTPVGSSHHSARPTHDLPGESPHLEPSERTHSGTLAGIFLLAITILGMWIACWELFLQRR